MGHTAWSYDLKPSLDDGEHVTGDVRRVLNDAWDLMIAFPPCTYLTTAANGWHNAEREPKRQEALDFVRTLMGAPIPQIALENPVGVISSQIRKPDQIIQPWMFGDPYIKRTCLWLKNLPRLQPTGRACYPWGVWDNVRHPEARSLTFPGVAKAMAEQWGGNGYDIRTCPET